VSGASTPRFAGALLAAAGGGALLALASTGHGRVVSVVALASLLLAVLDAVARLHREH